MLLIIHYDYESKGMYFCYYILFRVSYKQVIEQYEDCKKIIIKSKLKKKMVAHYLDLISISAKEN